MGRRIRPMSVFVAAMVPLAAPYPGSVFARESPDPPGQRKLFTTRSLSSQSSPPLVNDERGLVSPVLVQTCSGTTNGAR